MDTIHESSGRIEFRSHFSPAARMLILVGGLLPLLAPYELLIKPSWRGEITPVWLFFLVVSAGAVVVSALFVSVALFGLTRRVRFDAPARVITYAFRALALRHPVQRFPFSALEMLRVNTRAWTDGPDTYTLVATVRGYPEIEFGSFTDRGEAERYRSALQGLVEGGGSG